MDNGDGIVRIGRKLVRKGSCTHCGECCTDCPLVKWLPNGMSSCTIYPDRAKPEHNPHVFPDGRRIAYQSCTIFPSHPSQLRDSPHCTYEFYDAETGEKVVATDGDLKGEYDPVAEAIFNEPPT